MKIDEINAYYKQHAEEGLCEMTVSIKTDPNDVDYVYVTKIKEVYQLDSDADADRLINEAVQDATCVGHSKKFKQGKVNKQGETVRPDYFYVTLNRSLD